MVYSRSRSYLRVIPHLSRQSQHRLYSTAIRMEVQPLKHIVIASPTTAPILEKYGLDYCCSGNQTLKEACESKNLPLQQVLKEIQNRIEMQKQSNEDDKKFIDYTTRELVQHIVEQHHKYLREQIPSLQPLMVKVARVHGQNHPELIPLRDIVQYTTDDLLEHIDKEEQEAFGDILQNKEWNEDALKEWIKGLEKEHVETGNAFRQMEELTNGFTIPSDACTSYRNLFLRLQDFIRDMHVHVHKENYILFPKLLKEMK
jgi:regulator of cell morphogenesis and NO signaling